MRVPNSLVSLTDMGIIQEVLRPLMSGKEAMRKDPNAMRLSRGEKSKPFMRAFSTSALSRGLDTFPRLPSKTLA